MKKAHFKKVVSGLQIFFISLSVLAAVGHKICQGGVMRDAI